MASETTAKKTTAKKKTTARKAAEATGAAKATTAKATTAKATTAKATTAKGAATKTAAAKTAPTSAGAAFGADWLARFKARVEELRAHPDIRVFQYTVNPPAKEADLAAVEAHLGGPLPPAIRSLYAAADGFQLRWIHVRHPEFSEPKAQVKKKKLTEGDILGGNTIEHGLVNLLPVRYTFKDAKWKGNFWFEDMAAYEPVRFDKKDIPSLDFHRALRPFDLYHFYEIVAMLVPSPRGDFPVLFGTDHGVDWDDSVTEKKHPSFEDYLETVLARWAAVERGRVRPRSYWDSHPVSLKKLIGELELDDDDA
jgi:hypothetical protein